MTQEEKDKSLSQIMIFQLEVSDLNLVIPQPYYIVKIRRDK